MKARAARRFLKRNHLAIITKEKFSPSKQKRLKEAIRVALECGYIEEVKKDEKKNVS